jgi:hypothetical protein
MNANFNLTPEENELAAQLSQAAHSLQPDREFQSKLEARLKASFQPKGETRMNNLKTAGKALALIVLVTVFVLALNWVLKNALPNPQPARATKTSGFVCPVTEPNGSMPPGETVESPDYLGNGSIWTGLWPAGKVIMTSNFRNEDGSYWMKWWWWRGIEGQLTIEGHRLDGEADPLSADIPEGYGEIGFQVAALIFPTPGCWEVTGHVGEASLTFITEVIVAEELPLPAPTEAPTLAPNVYKWRNTTVMLAAQLPSAPSEVNLLTHSSAESDPTIEAARAFAEKFGIQGDVFDAPEYMLSGQTYLVSDGKQRMYYRSENNFDYYSDYNYASNGSEPAADPSGAIDEFLKSHGYDFEYRLIPSALGSGWYDVLPLTADGYPIWFENGMPNSIQIEVSDRGQVIDFNFHLLTVDAQPVGVYRILSAEEAWQKLLDDSLMLGKLESMRSASNTFKTWARTYAENEPATLYGQVTSFTSAEGGAPFISIDSFTLTGNTGGMESLERFSYVIAQGKFVDENGIRKFNVETWKFTTEPPAYVYGRLHREGDQFILSADEAGAEYTLTNPPADLPAEIAQVSVTGILNGTQLDWTVIMDYGNGNGGGGGGGGGNFAKLNLSGTPVAWATPAPTTAIEIGQQIEGMRGLVSISIYENADGSKRSEYTFFTPQASYLLEGEGLDQLVAYHNRPVTIWGTITAAKAINEYQIPIISVDRFEFPFPDLGFQILHGTQQLATLEGQGVILFTTMEGVTYAQLTPQGVPDTALLGKEGDKVLYETLIIPDESFGGYPAMRVFSGTGDTSLKTGKPAALDITADQPYEIPYYPPADAGEVPTLTIEKVELVYFTSDPRYAESYPDAMSPYLQPVWRFYGHYSDGSEIVILIQALDQEYLYPEPAPAVQGG